MNNEDIALIHQLISDEKAYNDLDEHIVAAHQHALIQCRLYNQKVNQNQGYDYTILRNLFAKVGDDPYVEPNFYCKFGFNISFGNEVFLNHDVTLLDDAPIIIGNQANIAPKVGIYTASPVNDITKRQQHYMIAKPVIIKDNVWIGGNVCILGGVTIGNNAIIGAGSVVTYDVPDNAIVIGNPAHVLRINK